MKIIRRGREAQIAFNSVISATRFKYFSTGALLPTVCPGWGRGQVGSPDHYLKCCSLEAPVRAGWDGTAFPAEMASEVIPAPWGMP